MYVEDDCYLWFNSYELNNNDSVYHAGLYPISQSTNDLSEVRPKYVQLLQESLHFSTRVRRDCPEPYFFPEPVSDLAEIGIKIPSAIPTGRERGWYHC
jgi:hypothetical protein